MEKSVKNYFKLIIICLIVLGLYFVIDSITSLKIFPKKINSGKDYISLVKKYGLPKVLKHTKLKLIERGVTIIPGKRCRSNIYGITGNKITKYSKVFDKKFREAELTDLKKNPLSKDLEEGMIDKIFSNFQGYGEKLEQEVLKDGTSSEKIEQVVKDFKNGKNIQSKKYKINEYKIKDGKKVKGKNFRADVYKSTLLILFKLKNKYLILTVEEKYYKCIFPEKTQFFTYKLKNNYAIVYYPRGATEPEFEKYLETKKDDKNRFAYFWSWKAKRSRKTWKKFYRLYKFTLPTPITCMMINQNMFLYGNNIHKKSNLIRTIRQALR